MDPDSTALTSRQRTTWRSPANRGQPQNWLLDLTVPRQPRGGLEDGLVRNLTPPWNGGQKEAALQTERPLDNTPELPQA